MSQVSAKHPRSGAAPRLPALTADSCLFLDVDGTLLDFAPTPAQAQVDRGLIVLLDALLHQLQGALALVSGRPIEDLDRLFSPLLLPAAGIHGVERRSSAGTAWPGISADPRLAQVRTDLLGVAAAIPGLLLEDKGSALALHFRRAPHARAVVRDAVEAAAARLGPDFRLLEGDMVFELKPAASDKGRAVEAFMQIAPFAGRTPVFLGDDYTDLDGFAASVRHGGIAIAVGDRVVAPWRLADPAAVRRWLAAFAGVQWP